MFTRLRKGFARASQGLRKGFARGYARGFASGAQTSKRRRTGSAFSFSAFNALRNISEVKLPG